MTFTVPSGDVDKALRVLGDNKEKIGYDSFSRSRASSRSR